MSVQLKLCPMCTFVCPTIPLLLNHLRLVHTSDPSFHVCCGINSCIVTCKSFSALYTHVYRHHPDEGGIRHRSTIVNTCVAEQSACSQAEEFQYPLSEESGSLETADINRLTGNDEHLQKRSSALFALKLKEQRRISQKALDDVIEFSKAQFDQTKSMFAAEVSSKLAEKGIDPDIIHFDSLLSKFSHPFSELDTKYKQDKYYKEKLGLIEPEEIKIGDGSYVRQFTGTKSRSVLRYDTYHYIPLLSTIEKLLSDCSIIEHLESFPSRIRNDGIIEDFCDASIYKNHPLFSKHPEALQIIAYFDELEVCNPLGTHVKTHKVGVLFFTLANIHPKFRSKFSALNLALLVTKPVIDKYGIDAVLKPFFRDCTTLATKGVSVQVNGSDHVWKGALLAFLADNLASNELGGFKLSFSFAFRCCRTCLTTNEDMSKVFNSDNVVLRNRSTHEAHCTLLKGPAESHYSKTYGINRRSALLDIPDFPIFNGGLPHDCMHDILEGVAATEIKLLLKHCIDSKYFSLDEYNQSLVNFNFGYTESDRPVPVLQRHLQNDKSMRCSASQMLLLLQILPFLIGDKVPESDPNWICFLSLRKIVDIVFCPVSTSEMANSLKLLIIEHHKAFVMLYSHYIPKLHFIEHYPEQMVQVGPLTRAWTMRHEAKLNFFKQATGISSFKNITLSLALHHQRLACYDQSTSKLLQSVLECGPTPSPPVPLRDEILKDCILEHVPGISMDTLVFRPNWVCRDGVTYKNNNAYVITGYDGLDPLFACIIDIIVIGGDLVLFNVRNCEVHYFDDHYHAYVINQTSQQSLISIDNILDRNVYHCHVLSDSLKYITLKYSFMYMS